MKKELMISIQPKHLVNILNGNKTVEIRKSVPKDFAGWIYLYCTKAKPYLINKDMISGFYEIRNDYEETYIGEVLNGKVVARFWFDEYDTHPFVDVSIPTGYEDWDGNFVDTTEEEMGYYITGDDLDKMCLSYNEVANYGKSKDLYAWHIKKLEIFNKPKYLSEFYRIIDYDLHEGLYKEPIYKTLLKAPQSWMYVEVKE